MLPPVINNVGEVVFRARSASQTDNNALTALGIYAKRPSFPLGVLVDNTCNGGVLCASPTFITPTFPVPGRPSGTRFSDFKAPLINDVGDVVFFARFAGVPGSGLPSGAGFYATHVSGGPIVALADTFTTVPGHPTAIFRTVDFVITQMLTVALNNNGEVVYWGDWLIPPAVFPNMANGIFGTTVSGGPGTLLADSTQNVAFTPLDVPGTPGSFRELRPTLAINNNTPGRVAFKGTLGPTPSLRAGIFSVNVTGGSIQTVAFQSQPAPGRTQTYGTSFGPSDDTVDINDVGTVVFQNNFFPSFPTEFGQYVGSATSAVGHTRILDTFGCSFGPCLLIPGETVPPAEHSGASFPNVNEAGQVGIFTRIINTSIPDQQGIYATDIDGSPISVVANLSTPPPGLPAPVGGFPRFSNGLFVTESAALNDFGHMAFGAGGLATSSSSFVGLYFYDACTPQLERIADSTVGLAALGLNFTSSQQNRLDIWQGEARNGHLKSISNLNDVAFAVAFSNFDSGMFIAHVDVGGGGQLAIACPPDITAECPIDGGVAANGTATATGCGTITVSSSDAAATGCGGTSSITRTWTADNGGTAASCVQTISETDTVGPVLSGVPDKTSVECGSTLPALPEVTANDACEGSVAVTLSETSSPGPCPGAYILTRTWTAIDGCGNTTEASNSICVIDTTDPTLMGVPADVTVECDAVPVAATPTSSDTCDTMPAIAFGEARTDGACPNAYTLNRTWTATDDCGNEVSMSQLVTVNDTIAPTLACPASTSLECPADTAVGANGSATGADNCGLATVSSSDAASPGAVRRRRLRGRGRRPTSAVTPLRAYRSSRSWIRRRRRFPGPRRMPPSSATPCPGRLRRRRRTPVTRARA